MIPENQSGILPPFINEGTASADRSPYKSTITDFVRRYAKSPERIIILKSLLEYRRKLKNVGITDGFQWLNGSFVEDIELNRNKSPKDIDVVTLAKPPTMEKQEWVEIINNNKELWHSEKSKEEFQCDTYFIDLNAPPEYVVGLANYWFGLFSHQRESLLWKGVVQVRIICSDDEALEILNEETTHV